MRALGLAPLLLLVAGCGPAEERTAPQPSETRTGPVAFAGPGRDRLCLDETAGRVGLISYGSGDRNCSLQGVASRQGDRLSITPDGDRSCRLGANVSGGEITLTDVGPACAYYCGPTASLQGKSFRRLEEPEPVADLTGDPLC